MSIERIVKFQYQTQDPTKLFSDGIAKNFKYTFDSLECYDVKKLQVLQLALRTIKRSSELGEIVKIERYLKLIDNLQNSINVSNSIVSGQSLYRNTSYGYSRSHENNRIYPLGPSLVFLPKELRYYLFAAEYIDIDMTNSHPAILLDFSIKNGISMEKVACLYNLVINRDSFYTLLETEGVEKPKYASLVTINGGKQYHNKSLHLRKLADELTLIRQKILEYFLASEPIFLDELKQTDEYRRKSKQKQLNHLQSLFCFKMESKFLLDFRSYILKHYENERLNVQLYSIGKKEIYSPSQILFTPFFDGFFLSVFNKDPLFNRVAQSLLVDFNDNLKKEYSFIKFIEKPIKHKYSVLNASLLKRYETIFDFLGTLTQYQFNQLLRRIKIEPFVFNPDSLKLYDHSLTNENENSQILKNASLDFEESIYNSLLPHASDNLSLFNLLKLPTS